MYLEDAHGSDDFPVLGFFVPFASCTTDESTCSGDGVGVLSLARWFARSRHHRTKFNVVFRLQQKLGKSARNEKSLCIGKKVVHV